MEKKGKVLLESASAGLVLALTPAQVRKLADQGVLPIEATTPRGGRLFRADVVERLRREREAVRAAVSSSTAASRSADVVRRSPRSWAGPGFIDDSPSSTQLQPLQEGRGREH